MIDQIPPQLLQQFLSSQEFQDYMKKKGITMPQGTAPTSPMGAGAPQLQPILNPNNVVSADATITPSNRQLKRMGKNPPSNSFFPQRPSTAGFGSLSIDPNPSLSTNPMSVGYKSQGKMGDNILGGADAYKANPLQTKFSLAKGENPESFTQKEPEDEANVVDPNVVPKGMGGMGAMQMMMNNPLFNTGINLDSSLYTLGRSIGYKDNISNPMGSKRGRRGNILRGIGAGGKAAMGIAGQIGAGMGQQNMLNNFWADYQKKQREGLVAPQYKNGGMYRRTIRHRKFENGGQYDIKSGDTLGQIAKSNGMTLAELLKKNPQFASNPDYIQVGQKVNLGDSQNVFTNPIEGEISHPKIQKAAPDQGLGAFPLPSELGNIEEAKKQQEALNTRGAGARGRLGEDVGSSKEFFGKVLRDPIQREASKNEMETNMANRDNAIALQRQLIKYGYDIGGVDGIYGDKTKAAHGDYLRKQNSYRQDMPNLGAFTLPNDLPAENKALELGNMREKARTMLSSNKKYYGNPYLNSGIYRNGGYYNNGGEYTIKSGDSLSKIAAANGMTLAQLLKKNPQFASNPNNIQVGQSVTLGASKGGSQPSNVSKADPSLGAFPLPSELEQNSQAIDRSGARSRLEPNKGGFFKPLPNPTVGMDMSKKDNVQALQLKLTNAGYDVGGIDGIYGKNTKAAHSQYLKSNGKPPQAPKAADPSLGAFPLPSELKRQIKTPSKDNIPPKELTRLQQIQAAQKEKHSGIFGDMNPFNNNRKFVVDRDDTRLYVLDENGDIEWETDVNVGVGTRTPIGKFNVNKVDKVNNYLKEGKVGYEGGVWVRSGMNKTDIEGSNAKVGFHTRQTKKTPLYQNFWDKRRREILNQGGMKTTQGCIGTTCEDWEKINSEFLSRGGNPFEIFQNGGVMGWKNRI